MSCSYPLILLPPPVTKLHRSSTLAHITTAKPPIIYPFRLVSSNSNSNYYLPPNKFKALAIKEDEQKLPELGTQNTGN